MGTEAAVRFLQQENIRLTKETESLRQQISMLERYLEIIKDMSRLDRQIVLQENPLDLLRQLLGRIIEAVGAKDGSISRLDAAAGELVFVLVHGQLTRRLENYRIKSDMGIAGWVVENKEPIIVNNPRQDWRFSLQVDQEFGFLTQSIISAPVMSQEKLIGVIQLLNKHPHGFARADVVLLLIFSQLAARVLERLPLPENPPQ